MDKIAVQSLNHFKLFMTEWITFHQVYVASTCLLPVSFLLPSIFPIFQSFPIFTVFSSDSRIHILL